MFINNSLFFVTKLGIEHTIRQMLTDKKKNQKSYFNNRERKLDKERKNRLEKAKQRDYDRVGIGKSNDNSDEENEENSVGGRGKAKDDTFDILNNFNNNNNNNNNKKRKHSSSTNDKNENHLTILQKEIVQGKEEGFIKQSAHEEKEKKMNSIISENPGCWVDQFN